MTKYNEKEINVFFQKKKSIIYLLLTKKYKKPFSNVY